ncbi:hypothetical protein ACP70R_039217 [Stipagrostis hirtigluma subsp. patula]
MASVARKRDVLPAATTAALLSLLLVASLQPFADAYFNCSLVVDDFKGVCETAVRPGVHHCEAARAEESCCANLRPVLMCMCHMQAHLRTISTKNLSCGFAHCFG